MNDKVKEILNNLDKGEVRMSSRDKALLLICTIGTEEYIQEFIDTDVELAKEAIEHTIEISKENDRNCTIDCMLKRFKIEERSIKARIEALEAMKK